MRIPLIMRLNGMLEPTVRPPELSEVKVGQVITVETVKDRASLCQNSLIHQWYKDWASMTNDSIVQVSRQCKLCFGVPILRGDDPDYCRQYDKAIKGRFNYYEKLELMDYWPVTRLMSKKQKSLYLDTMQKEAALMGVYLQSAEDIGKYA